MPQYSLHIERFDGTLDGAFITYPAKSTALKVAKEIAKKPQFDAMNLIVNNSKKLTVAIFPFPKMEDDKNG